MDIKFRDLRANEIDVRVNAINGKGFSLLLYKDARVDMDILDEAVGSMNWKREHTRDNANCIVSIWDEEKHQWIGKEDTGTESNTAKEKGLASDSFKRACFNWGIGRELYTAPSIYIPVANDDGTINVNIEDAGNNRYRTKDKFKIEKIEITDKIITGIAILNCKLKKRVFVYTSKEEG